MGLVAEAPGDSAAERPVESEQVETVRRLGR